MKSSHAVFPLVLLTALATDASIGTASEEVKPLSCDKCSDCGCETSCGCDNCGCCDICCCCPPLWQSVGEMFKLSARCQDSCCETSDCSSCDDCECSECQSAGALASLKSRFETFVEGIGHGVFSRCRLKRSREGPLRCHETCWFTAPVEWTLFGVFPLNKRFGGPSVCTCGCTPWTRTHDLHQMYPAESHDYDTAPSPTKPLKKIEPSDNVSVMEKPRRMRTYTADLQQIRISGENPKPLATHTVSRTNYANEPTIKIIETHNENVHDEDAYSGDVYNDHTALAPYHSEGMPSSSNTAAEPKQFPHSGAEQQLSTSSTNPLTSTLSRRDFDPKSCLNRSNYGKASVQFVSE